MRYSIGLVMDSFLLLVLLKLTYVVDQSVIFQMIDGVIMAIDEPTPWMDCCIHFI